MIGIVDYEAGNIASVTNGLRAIGAQFIVSSDPTALRTCDGIILPGVGSAPGAMSALRRRGLDSFLVQNSRPLLGICLGMQLLYESSEEGKTACLGLLTGSVRKFDASKQKVPHMGWNEVRRTKEVTLLNGIRDAEYFYFAHSYFAGVDSSVVAVSVESHEFAAVVANGNCYGTQFHPEKSGDAGLKLLRNFEDLCK